MRAAYVPQVLVDHNGRPLIVYGKGRTRYHAVAAAGRRIRLVSLLTLRGLRELHRRGDPYPARRAASFWLNHDHRAPTKRARQVLRGLVSRRRDQGSGPIETA